MPNCFDTFFTEIPIFKNPINKTLINQTNSLSPIPYPLSPIPTTTPDRAENRDILNIVFDRTAVELSSRLEYALVALLEIADRQAQGKPLKVNEIAASQSLPERYLDQIFTSLKRQGILSSQRGMKGGYLLAKELWQITLLDVVIAIEGGGDRKKVDPAIPNTLEKTVIIQTFAGIKESVNEILISYTLQDLAKTLETQRQSSPMYYI